MNHTHQLPARRSMLAGIFGTAALALSGCMPEAPASPLDTAGGMPPATRLAAPPQMTPAVKAPAATWKPAGPAPLPRRITSRAQAVREFAKVPAGDFGLEVRGVQLGLPKGSKYLALTFDACGGEHGTGYDAALIKALRRHQVPATLFINSRWAQANRKLTAELVADPLFEIANHGTVHRPLSVNGRAAYKIPGTTSVGAAYDEVMRNQKYLQSEFGATSRFFRSGTAHFDVASASLTRKLGLIPMNFTVNLDGGATLPASAVRRAALGMRRGDVGIGHFNRPGGDTAEGIAGALPRMLDSGIRFVRLDKVL
ncbi:polysaccharide deacetylase family protein [Paeniglutamicibacter cryotolerans]|uniref:Peptidoglycan/xylan/chitin deacetylase (PgdA/CDA1 family) n=1 Tax=Paeniglutamicibacter cryotolerans TaxID=670079 RepID=A0A839QXZ2_9MICC|nr:polysaccharide deacetylase family protein [Paeniglutamicibacter cryotolerans]MBB2996821.1 peptidoglycan/xylan/chitin deacetylase (PgdA/CDA1 family) [Paeniglutamicibacter cryotolerans]